MRYSHSRLNTILSCPMTYYLSYEQKISRKEKPRALFIGSAVHYGLENNITVLDDYFKENGNFKQQTEFSDEQLLAESMLEGYQSHKNDIYDQILSYNGERLELIKEEHELELYAPLNENDEFFGIIDLLLFTNKGFIIIDYKTSSNTPNWNDYLEQIYRYIFLLQHNFPDVPILKIGIINLRKCQIRKKKNENDDEFKRRIKFEYELNDENYINYHEYLPCELDKTHLEDYIRNLYYMCDMANVMINSKIRYINYTAANGVYKSQYLEIFNHTENSYLLYEIEDEYFVDGEIVHKRDCIPLDMECIYGDEYLVNKYTKFEQIRKCRNSLESTIKYLELFYKYDIELLNNYEKVYEIKSKEVENESQGV